MKIKTKGRNNSLFLIFLILVMTFSFFSIPTFQTALPIRTADSSDVLPKASQIVPRNVRIAIYDEPNVTQPGYTSGNTLTNNYTALILLLESAGFDVTTLTCADIYNHALMTADFDIFIMVDNVPRENITNHVKEFWLGGGGILSFDSALPYLCYAGIIIPESEGDDGRLTYWTYQSGINHNISMRHPITKDYQVNDKYSTGTWMNYFYWSVVQGTSVGTEIVKLSNREGNYDAATAVALRRSDIGGPIVHLPGTANIIGINMSSLITDAIDWLCPRPKARVVFDLSHRPRLGVDDWDDLTQYPGYYSEWRNNLVSRSYTFDKLYPSALGNFTLDRLSKYDLLVVVLPDLNYSISELNTISNWGSNGGSLLVLGEMAIMGFLDGDKQINLLLTDYNLEMNLTYHATAVIDAKANSHPTIEGCTNLRMDSRGAINISGDAYALWEYEGNIHVACQDTGNGRIILVADMNWVTNSQIANQDNRQFGVNMVNWLTASEAEVLIFIQDHVAASPNDNIYRGPVANALNELGISFHMTFTKEYLNLSLADSSYKLVVIDNTMSTIMDTVGMSLLNFLKSGGYLIVDTWTYRNAAYNYLWDYLGFSYAGNHISISPPIVNIWNPSHAIFSNPANYGADTIETTLNFAATDYTNLTLHSNATAIAGLTLTHGVSGGAIIIGANGHAISNALHLTEYYDDTDDSTYPDGLEIWTNEIAFMWAQITAIPPGTPGIPGYDVYMISFAIVFSIGVISIIKIRKIRKN